MITAVVWRLPLPGTVVVTLVSAMAWFILGAVILDEGKIFVIILVKITITVHIKKDMDLFLREVENISFAKHCIEHAEVSGVRRETGCVRDMSDMVVEVRVQVCVVT